MKECIKTGIRFQIDGEPEKTYTGDMFWDMARVEFLIRGIPRLPSGEMASFRAPADIRLREVKEAGVWEDSQYAYLRFNKATASDNFLKFIDEWYGSDFPQMHKVIMEEWTNAKLIA